MGNRLQPRCPSPLRQRAEMSLSSAKSPARAAATWPRSGEATVRAGWYWAASWHFTVAFSLSHLICKQAPGWGHAWLPEWRKIMEKPWIRQTLNAKGEERDVLTMHVSISYYQTRSEKGYVLQQSTALSQQIPLCPNDLLPSPQSCWHTRCYQHSFSAGPLPCWTQHSSRGLY